MAESISVGITGDHDPGNPTHTATEEALEHAGASLGACLKVEGPPTETLARRAGKVSRCFGAVFCAPNTPSTLSRSSCRSPARPQARRTRLPRGL